MPELRPPNYLEYHRSITDELNAMKNRVRGLIYHWQTDGEWKEACLRRVLDRHLPETAKVGRGFIITEKDCSTQIDVLVVDSRKPIIFRDGDLYVVTPDAVLAAIEVKTELHNKNSYIEALEKLAKVKEMASIDPSQIWTGLFIYDTKVHAEKWIKRALYEGRGNARNLVNCISAGPGIFVRKWESSWKGYNLDCVAASYFVGNLISWISRCNGDSVGADYAWFPIQEGKEAHCIYTIPF